MSFLFVSCFFLLHMSTICTSVHALATLNTRSAGKRLLDLLSKNKANKQSAIPLAGVHDALSAKIFASSGAQALFLSGFGVSASRLGEPDAGILSRNEMEDATRAVVAAVSSQNRDTVIIVDGDTGYGGTANVRRTVRGMANAGAAAITIEDQTFPKKCTFAMGSSGVNVVSRQDARDRIRTALKARDEALEEDGNSILVIARTDCRVAMGFDEAAERCRIFEELGADIVYAENLQSVQEYEQLRAFLSPSTPMMLAQVQLEPDAKNLMTVNDVGRLGYSLALFGVTALQATVGALEATARQFLDKGGGIVSQKEGMTPISSFENVKQVVGFSELDDFEEQYGCQ